VEIRNGYDRKSSTDFADYTDWKISEETLRESVDKSALGTPIK
jgi:hypothetical protein